MSNAEQAWKEYLEFTTANGFDEPHEQSFMAGFIAGVGNAWDLPEVRAEELKIGKWYIASGLVAEGPIPVWCASEIRNDRERIGSWFQCFGDEHSTLAVKNVSFRGPLQMGDWK